MNSDFEPPSKKWAFLATIGGVATAIAIVIGMEQLSSHLKQSAISSPLASASATPISTSNPLPAQTIDAIAKLDVASIKLIGTPVATEQQQISNPPYVAPQVGKLSDQELAIARQAWRYFEQNWNEDTGLVDLLQN